MFEKYEKFWILGLIALAVYYFYKKGSASQAAVTSAIGGPPNPPPEPATIYSTGSLVNPTDELFSGQPAQTSTPVLFKPAQPSAVQVSQRVSSGQWTFYPAPPVLRSAPADRVLAFS